MSVEDKVRDYILQNYLFTDDRTSLRDDESFLDKGIIDSTGVLELVGFIEEKYQFTIEDDELVPDNLDSVDNLVKFIEKKTQ